MRYFKYKGHETAEKEVLREQYARLTKIEKRLVRKDKAIHAIGTILCFLVGIACFFGCIELIARIPISDTVFLKIIDMICLVFLWIVATVISAIVGALVGMPFWSKAIASRSMMKQRILSQACAHLREYYGLREPCLITKCYDSSDKKFKKHDVCIFVVGDELRITTNLKNGFLHAEKDLGCYAFTFDEISLSKIQGQKNLIAELKAENAVFLLGYRAKGFIEKNVPLRKMIVEEE